MWSSDSFQVGPVCFGQRVRHGVLLGGFLLVKGMHELKLALADAGVVLIALSLMVGPLARLWPRAFSKLLAFRREIGIWGGVTSLLHVVVLASGKLGWIPLGWFLVSSETGYALNTGSEGLGSLIGTVAAFLLLVLLLTSNNWSQQKLGVGMAAAECRRSALRRRGRRLRRSGPCLPGRLWGALRVTTAGEIRRWCAGRSGARRWGWLPCRGRSLCAEQVVTGCAN